jgi:hypothetical protein
MTFELSGTASDELPTVLATGKTDVRKIFLSLSAREPNGRDADYLEWHSLDHRPEQYRIAGIRHSIRWVSTAACRAARSFADAHYDAVDHVMTYFFAEDAAFDQFTALSTALTGARRPFRLPSVAANYFDVAGKIAARKAIAGADVIPWRPARGVYLIVEQNAPSPATLIDIPGIAGIWWHTGGVPPSANFSDNSGTQATFCFLDDDPIETAQRLRAPLAQRWAAAPEIQPLLAAPFHTLVPFEWSRYLP